ncbi:hypothetical protein EJV46_17605 [Roseococcus sp. SYP-B2431]|nr:hypothetical protein EJV46_17605 [Roseococcus sp. SYP-B2431]
MRALLVLLLVLPIRAVPAAAQVPVCNGLREGMTACFDGRLCRCRFEQGAQFSGRPDAHRWDCGALRPDCRPNDPQTPWPNIVPQIYLDGSRAPPGPKPR